MSAPKAAESALVVLVPEAEPQVQSFRVRYDPSAAAGVPAHITLLYPFKPPHAIDDVVLGALRSCFNGFSPFRFSLRQARQFPDVFYLAPEPDEPFRQLTLAIWRAFPDTPPYGGRYPDIVPHLSVAQLEDTAQLERIAAEFEQTARLPVNAEAHDVTLMDTASGRWEVRTGFRLGTTSTKGPLA
jgi:2'-5' RNA ligase